MRQGADSPRELSSPHPVLRPTLGMRHVWCLEAYAAVRTLFIVECDELTYTPPCIVKILITVFPVYDLGLDYAVQPFGYGIVCRAVIFRHAYPDVVHHQQFCVGIAAVLDATVRMVYETLQLLFCRLFHGHTKCRQGMCGLEGLRHAETDDLVRIGIGYQVQVTGSLCQVNISYVAGPQLVRTVWYEAFYQIPVLVIPVI